MKIDLVFITYNRLEYTKLALKSVLADPQEKFSLTIWDNGSTDGTIEYLKNKVKDPRISNIIFSKANIGQVAAINQIWSHSKADLVGKLDNDCLVTSGWTRVLAKAHEGIDKLGVVACWHFFPEDFNYELAKHKIQSFGNHQIFRHPWTCGTGLLLKRKIFNQIGPIQGRSTTKYWLKIALRGFINGFYFPLIYQEHMDDPRSKYCNIHKMSFNYAYKHSFGYQTKAIKNINEYKSLHDKIIHNLLYDPFEAKFYTGWRVIYKKFVKKIENAIKFSK
ncbi:MAG: glycosyltransferase family 2 protein [Phycisphaerae bacterium]